MARRMLESDIWQDEKFGEKLDYIGKLLFIGIITLANDYGKLRGNANYLKTHIFPYNNVNILPQLKKIQELKMIYVYEANNETFIKIKNWVKHQTLFNKGKDRIPEPDLKLQKEIIVEQALDESDEQTKKEQVQFKEQLKQVSKQLLKYLNQQTGKRFEINEVNLHFIESRLKEKNVDETICKRIIDYYTDKWKYDEKMKEYLRPATLFNKTKFNQYKGEVLGIIDKETKIREQNKEKTEKEEQELNEEATPEEIQKGKDFVKKLRGLSKNIAKKKEMNKEDK